MTGNGPAPAVRRSSPGFLRTVRIAVLALVLVLFASEYSNLIDRYFIFRPDEDLSADPGAMGLEFEDVRFTAADGVALHGWFVPGSNGATLVLLHGNAGNISGRLSCLAELHRRLGMNVLIFDYRGYGLSEGRPSEKGTYLDAEAALDYLGSRGDVDPERIVLFGHSLGTAIAVETAVRREVYAVLLEAPFTSIRAMAGHNYPFVPGIGRILRTKYDSLSKIEDLGAPLLVIHGDRGRHHTYPDGARDLRGRGRAQAIFRDRGSRPRRRRRRRGGRVLRGDSRLPEGRGRATAVSVRARRAIMGFPGRGGKSVRQIVSLHCGDERMRVRVESTSVRLRRARMT